MEASQEARLKLAVSFLQLAEESTRKTSVSEAMRFAGYSEEEINNPTRKEEATVRRAYNRKKKQPLNIDVPVKEVHPDHNSPVSPLSEIQSAQSNDSTTTIQSNTSALKKTSNIILPGMKIVRQTSHQVHAIAQNALLLKKLRDNAIKETTKAWVEASELEKKGKPHQLKKEIIEMTNSKPQYRGIVQVSERSIRRFVEQGIIGVTPPRRGNPGFIPLVAYKALKDALISFISIHQASGKCEYKRSELSNLVNEVINANPEENRRKDHLMARLQKDFGPEINLGKSETMEERRIRWTTFQNLTSWGDHAKEIIIELGFGRQSHPNDNVIGEVYFFEGQLDRIINFDETRIGLDQTDTQRGGRPSFVFFDAKKPRPGSSTNKSSLSLTIIVGGTAAGEMIPPHFQFTTDGQNEALQVWNTSIIKYMHDVKGRFGHEQEKYHPCTYGMNEKGGMNKWEFEEYVKNSLVTLYPDAADMPGKRVLLKADSGPGRKNTELMAYLRVRGFYFIPGLPNSTHVSQEMELLIGELKSAFHKNLEKLTSSCIVRKRLVPSGAEIISLLLFGGQFIYNEPNEQAIDKDNYQNAFQLAGNKDKVVSYFEKIGFAPFTRKYLENKHVRHDAANDPMAVEYDALESCNTTACAFLDAYGYDGSLLLAKVSRNLCIAVEQQPLTRPTTIGRARALAGAVTHGQQFKVTGGHHLTSDDFMVADALGNLEKEQKAMTAERRARQKYQQQFESALPLLEKPENSLLAKELDILLRYKLGELPGTLKTTQETKEPLFAIAIWGAYYP